MWIENFLFSLHHIRTHDIWMMWNRNVQWDGNGKSRKWSENALTWYNDPFNVNLQCYSTHSPNFWMYQNEFQHERHTAISMQNIIAPTIHMQSEEYLFHSVVHLLFSEINVSKQLTIKRLNCQHTVYPIQSLTLWVIVFQFSNWRRFSFQFGKIRMNCAVEVTAWLLNCEMRKLWIEFIGNWIQNSISFNATV